MSVLLISMGFSGCKGNTGGNGSADKSSIQSTTQAAVQEKEKKDPIKLVFPNSRVGSNGMAPYEAKILENFKQKYNGEIELQIEELPSSQAYVDKMKILMASGDMPDVVQAVGGLLDLAAKGNLFVDLKPYLDADPEWKEAVGEDAVETNTRAGKLVSVSEQKSVAGYYYNTEMFDKAGIKPAETWDEWFGNLDKLKATGVIPIALMTGENAWTTNLILGSIIGTDGEAGNAFMNTLHPSDYKTPEVTDALKKIQRMFEQYTSKDALGATYNVAANNFLSGKAAIIANGIWMTSDFGNPEKAIEGLAGKIDIAVYPENGLYSVCDPGFMVLSKDKEHADAAVKLVKAHSDLEAQQLNFDMNGNFPLSPKVNVSAEVKEKNPLAAKLLDLSFHARYKYNFLDEINYPNVLDQYAALYPALAMGKMTAEEMAAQLSEAAAKNE